MLAKLEDSQPFSEHYDKCVSKRTFYNSSMRCLVDSGFIIRLEDRKNENNVPAFKRRREQIH